jgi:hypothetical protein
MLPAQPFGVLREGALPLAADDQSPGKSRAPTLAARLMPPSIIGVPPLVMRTTQATRQDWLLAAIDGTRWLVGRGNKIRGECVRLRHQPQLLLTSGVRSGGGGSLQATFSAVISIGTSIGDTRIPHQFSSVRAVGVGLPLKEVVMPAPSRTVGASWPRSRSSVPRSRLPLRVCPGLSPRAWLSRSREKGQARSAPSCAQGAS